MSSREKILSAIKANKPEETSLPAFNFEADTENLVEKFQAVLTGIGGSCIHVAGYDGILDLNKLADTFYVQCIKEIDGYNAEEYEEADAHVLEAVQTVYIKGEIGVAENGSIWVPEGNMVNRLLPFICQHLVLVIDSKNIVANMHEAYKRIQVNEDGYGAFIAGPSKTADIEQSLVIGAHGPLSLQVFIVNDKETI